MTASQIWEIVGLVLSVLMCAFFSMTETAFSSFNRYRFKVQADEGKKQAKLIVWLYEHFDSTLITVLIGNNVFAIALSVLSTSLFLSWLNGIWDENVTSLVISIVMGFVTFLFGDTIPKYLGKGAPNHIVKFTCYPLICFFVLFYPLGLLFRGVSFLAKKLFRAKPTPEITEDDFSSAVEEAEDEGEFEENESDIIQASLDFDDTAVKEVFTPIAKMSMLNLEGLSQEELLDFLKKTPYSRIPCYRGNKDNVVGILIVKVYLSAYFKDPKVDVTSLLKKPYVVSPSVKIDDLIVGFREHQAQIAIVKKGNKVLGMVSTEDCLEELVGKIAEPAKGGVK